MSAAEAFERDGICARWNAGSRLVLLSFRPQTRLTGASSVGLFQFLNLCVRKDEPWCLLGDLSNLADVDVHARLLAREFLQIHRKRMRMGAYGPNLLIRTMFRFFVLAAGMHGDVCATREEALAWLGVSAEYAAL